MGLKSRLAFMKEEEENAEHARCRELYAAGWVEFANSKVIAAWLERKAGVPSVVKKVFKGEWRQRVFVPEWAYYLHKLASRATRPPKPYSAAMPGTAKLRKDFAGQCAELARTIVDGRPDLGETVLAAHRLNGYPAVIDLLGERWLKSNDKLLGKMPLPEETGSQLRRAVVDAWRGIGIS